MNALVKRLVLEGTDLGSGDDRAESLPPQCCMGKCLTLRIVCEGFLLTGLSGLGPEDLSEGDPVVVIFGADMPSV